MKLKNRIIIRNRQITASGEPYTYDVIGRRLTKGSTSYLYLGDEEIGSYEKGLCKELQVPGLHRAAAIEKDSVAYLPIYDVQGTIRYLVDPSSMQIAEENDCDAFGRGLNPRIPYSYAGKRFDAATGLIYFGQRYYDPNLGRWLTQDPAGSVDSSNLYQYVFNNPLVYRDLDGQFAFVIPILVWGAEFVWPALSACIAPIIYGAVADAVVYGGYQLTQTLNKADTSWSYIPAASSCDYMNCSTVDSFEYSLYKKNNEKRSSDEPGSPPHKGDELGNDPAKCPGKGYEWKGDGPQGSKQGSWVKGSKKNGNLETLRPDLDHPQPKGPHWDYTGPKAPKGARLFPDGTWEPK